MCVCIYRRVETELNAILWCIRVCVSVPGPSSGENTRILTRAYARVHAATGMFAHTGRTMMVYTGGFVRPPSATLLSSSSSSLFSSASSSPACR